MLSASRIREFTTSIKTKVDASINSIFKQAKLEEDKNSQLSGRLKAIEKRVESFKHMN